MSLIKEIFIQSLIVIAFTFAAFWIIITGVTLIPKMTDYRIIYSIGTVCLSVIVMAIGLNLLGLLGDKE